MTNNFLKKLFLALLILVSGILHSQVDIQIEELTPDDNNQLGYNEDTLKAWICDILRGPGGMIDTSTIKFTGNYQALGRFYNGNDVGFNKGLIISNGKVEQAEAPNNIGAKSYAFNQYSPLEHSGDEDLLSMYKTLGIDTAIFYTGDAAAIEFVYHPFGDRIEMDYVFASEEYPSSGVQPSTDVDLTDFPNTPQVFDLFAISIKKFGFQNLAFTAPTLPGGPPFQPPEPERWVNVKHINSNSNPSYYKPNPNFGLSLGTQFDGMTKSPGDLGALNIFKNEITPCGSYNVKIVIEDFFWESPNPDQIPSGFEINSAVFLKENGLISTLQSTNTHYSDWKVDYFFINSDLEGEIVENCNYVEATFTLDDTINIDYHIPFKIELASLRDYVEVAYKGGNVITNDTITFYHGDSTKTITIKAKNLNNDYPNMVFMYPDNPCDWPGPFGGGFQGRIRFNLRKNEPIAFTANPKVYEAYCKETIELTITDVTENGVDPLSYYWDGDIVANDTINYKVQASPDYINILVNDNCDNESNGVVQINNKPVILEQILDAFLCGPGQFADVPVTALQPNYSDYTIDYVKWYKGTQLLSEADGNVIHVVYDVAVGDGIWTCTFEITDCCGGIQTGTFIVNQSELTLGNDVWICKGDVKELIANVTAESFIWYEVSNPSDTLSITNTVTVSPEVTTEYALEILDDCGETQTAYITVNVDLFEPQITIDPASAEICPGEEITLYANNAVEWNWTPGGATTQSITLNPTIPDVYQYTLTASSDYCFNKVTSATFEVFPNPIANFIIDPANDACTGESIVFTYTDIISNETFEWNFDDGSPIVTEENPSHVYTLPGNYNVHLRVDKYICNNDTTIDLIINPLPTPDFNANIVNGCIPVDVDFDDTSGDVQPGATYEWSFGDGETDNTSGNTSHEYTQAGLYNVTLTINNTARCGETIVKPNYIQVNPNPVAGFDPNPPITTMDTPTIEFINTTLNDSAIITYEWEFGDGTYDTIMNPSHTYTNPGEYEVLLYVETINGCYDTIIGKVALTEEAVLFIPNAFTPNNDGINDKFEIKGTPIADYNLYIYNKWGQVIWSTHNFNIHWDGTDRSGSTVPTGTYMYQVKGTDYLKQTVNYQGTVTVVR